MNHLSNTYSYRIHHTGIDPDEHVFLIGYQPPDFIRDLVTYLDILYYDEYLPHACLTQHDFSEILPEVYGMSKVDYIFGDLIDIDLYENFNDRCIDVQEMNSYKKFDHPDLHYHLDRIMRETVNDNPHVFYEKYKELQSKEV